MVYGAYGNANTDTIAYLDVGIRPNLVYLVKLSLTKTKFPIKYKWPASLIALLLNNYKVTKISPWRQLWTIPCEEIFSASQVNKSGQLRHVSDGAVTSYGEQAKNTDTLYPQ